MSTLCIACVAGYRKGGREESQNESEREKGPRSFRALRARLSPFPPLRVPATQASLCTLCCSWLSVKKPKHDFNFFFI